MQDTIPKCSTRSHLPIELLFSWSCQVSIIFQNWFCFLLSCPFILQLFCAFRAFSTCLISVLILLVGFTWHDHSSFQMVRTLCNPSEGESVYRGPLNWYALQLLFLLSFSAYSKLENLKRFDVHYAVWL